MPSADRAPSARRDAYALDGGLTLVLREAREPLVPQCGRTVALRILAARFGDDGAAGAFGESLLSFQREAVERASAILARRGGVLIADSVGLGKTHVAAELIRRALDDRRRVCVVGPSALERHWRAALRDVGPCDWISYVGLSRSGMLPRRHDLVVFDEAHALRNPATRRYRAASALCSNAQVVLLSATPVNNSVWDLYHLLRLFAGDRHFRDAGVASLRAAFADAEAAARFGSAPSLQRILGAVVIRRTRAFVRELADREAAGGGLVFPGQEAPRPVYYALADRETLERVATCLLELEFPAHAGGGVVPAELMRRGLLKRLESSAFAFRRSLDAYAALLDRCLSALDRGLLVYARDERRRDDDGPQLRLDELLFRPVVSPEEAERYRAAVRRERTLVDGLRAPFLGREDAKLAALEELLGRELRGRRILVFTQFRDTARHLHARLRAHFRCALIDGGGALLGSDHCTRDVVVRRFAPLANHEAPPHPREAVDILIATDLLSEGFNLQDASVVVSYDLPWNPVRMLQRIGRVDRLGSRHASTSSFHFLPGDLDRYLGLVERIARKTAAIEATIGSDLPLLHADLVRALDRRDAKLVDRIEREDADWFERDERLRRLLTVHGRPAEHVDGVPVAPLPSGTLGGEPSGLVAALVGARFEWVAVVRGSPVLDERLCADVLERAVACPIDSGVLRDPARVEAILGIARRVFAARSATASTRAILPDGGPAARLGRRLLGLVAALPGGPDPALCARVEAALERLASAPDASIAALDRPRAAEACTLPVFLERIDRLPTRPAALDAPATHQETAVRILGILVENPVDR